MSNIQVLEFPLVNTCETWHQDRSQGALVQGRTANARSEKMVRTDPEWDANEELPIVIGHRVAMC